MIENLRHVRAFLAVARVGNFTRAAKVLHVSQSALTVQIQQLESDLGTKLFDRGKRRIALTQAGRELLHPLERMVYDAEQIMSRTRELSDLQRGWISMAVLPSIGSRLAPFAVKRFRSLYPGVEVRLVDVVGDKLLDAVRREEVDFGIGKRPGPDRDFLTTPLLTDRMVAFVHRSHPLGLQESVSLRDIVASPLILLGRDSTVWELVNQSLAGSMLAFKLAYEINYLPTALGLVEAGLGVAILPEMGAGAKISPKIRRIPIRNPELSRHIDIIQKAQTTLSPAATKMVEIIRDLAKTSAFL